MSKKHRKGDKVKANETKTTVGKAEAGKVPGSVVASTAAAPIPEAAKEAAAPTSKPLKIQVLKPDTVYRGARAEWFKRLKEFNGKTEGEFLADTVANPPALTRNGTKEPPAGWMGFFKRQGVVNLIAA